MRSAAPPPSRSAPADPTLQFLVACRSKSLATARQLLENGADVHGVAPGKDGGNAWHMLAERRAMDDHAPQAEFETFAALLAGHGVAMNTRNEGRQSPLGVAVNTSNWRAMPVLLEHGADPNLPMDETWALTLTAEDGAVLAVQALLAHGANVHAQDDSGWTALHRAALSSRVMSADGGEQVGACVAMLLAAGANVHQGTNPDPSGNPSESPLRLALRRNSPVVAQRLLDGGALTGVGVRERTALLDLGMEKQHWAVLAVLVARGAADRVRPNRLQRWVETVPPGETLHRLLEGLLLRQTLNRTADPTLSPPARRTRARL